MKIEIGPKPFNSFSITGQNVEGGIILHTVLALDGDPVDTVQTIVPGKGNALNGRVRKAVKSLILGAFPKPVRDEVDETLPLPGAN